MAFTNEQLQAYRDATVPDLVGVDCKLLFVGINPGLWTAATQTHFCHPSNRFYPALRLAGIIDWVVDTSTGMTERQRSDFVDRGIGISNVVERATARASELSTDELRSGGEALVRRVERIEPEVVAIAGVTAFRSAFSEPKAALGEQTEAWSRSSIWVVPNPSGLNAHETVETLADWYGTVAEEAGVL